MLRNKFPVLFLMLILFTLCLAMSMIYQVGWAAEHKKIGVAITSLQGVHADDLEKLGYPMFMMYGGEGIHHKHANKITLVPYAWRLELDTDHEYCQVWNEPERQPDGSPGHTSQWTHGVQPSMSQFILWFQGVEWRNCTNVFGNNRNPQNSLQFYNEFVAAYEAKLGSVPDIDIIGTHCYMDVSKCEDGLVNLHEETGLPVAITEFGCTSVECFREYKQLIYKYDWIEYALYFSNWDGSGSWWSVPFMPLVDESGELTEIGLEF